MQRPKLRRIQFINIANPEQNASANRQERKEAYSHASWAGHARVRLLRTKQYQAAKQQHSAATEEGEQRHTEYRLLSDIRDSESAKLAAQLQLRSPVCNQTSSRRDPFDSLAFSFQSADHMLLDHYVTTVVPYLKTHCKKLQARSSHVDAMVMDWVKLAITSEGFLSGLLLTSSRHLSYCYRHNSSKQHAFSQLAIRHKLTCIQNISGCITIVGDGTTFSDSIVAQVMVLAFDEVNSISAGCPTSLTVRLEDLAGKHADGQEPYEWFVSNDTFEWGNPDSWARGVSWASLREVSQRGWNVFRAVEPR